MRTGVLAAGLLCLLPAAASADALDWLQRMNQAVRQQTYSGTAVYRNGEQLESLRIYHAFQDGEEHERMYSLSGPRREIVRRADEVTCILSEQQAVLTDNLGLRSLLPKLPRAAFEQLASVYELIEYSETSRVAGQSCRQIEIRARDVYRYSYSICLDEQTALPLDIRLLSERNELLEQVIFTSIDYPKALGPEVFEVDVDTSDFRHIQQQPGKPAVPEQEQDVWEMQELPAGFRLATREFGRWPGSDSAVTQLLYTDGLASVSIFATQQQLPEAALQGLTRMGGVNAYGRISGDHHITVIGEVPQATVRYFGDNLRQVSLPDSE